MKSDTFKVIIAGTRNFDDYQLLKRYADKILANVSKPIEIVSGRCRGADLLGEHYASEKRFLLTFFEAKWSEYGRRAGPMRNAQMASYADALIALWDGKSKGTKNMIDEALKAGISIRVINYVDNVCYTPIDNKDG